MHRTSCHDDLPLRLQCQRPLWFAVSASATRFCAPASTVHIVSAAVIDIAAVLVTPCCTSGGDSSSGILTVEIQGGRLALGPFYHGPFPCVSRNSIGRRVVCERALEKKWIEPACVCHCCFLYPCRLAFSFLYPALPLSFSPSLSSDRVWTLVGPRNRQKHW